VVLRAVASWASLGLRVVAYNLLNLFLRAFGLDSHTFDLRIFAYYLPAPFLRVFEVVVVHPFLNYT
jgi:hypothetical protein